MIEPILRNTKMKIAKSFIENDFDYCKEFSKIEMSSSLWLMQKEIETFCEELFENKGDIYVLKKNFVENIKNWKQHHLKALDNKEILSKNYLEIFSKFEKDFNFMSFFDEIYKCIPELHWIFLPIYSDQMIYNRRVNPEESMKDYYYHFHSLRDLKREIDRNPHYWKTLKGDINLNQDCDFPIYTNRFGYEDVYKVRRVYNGWDVVNFIGIGAYCTPNGKGIPDGKGNTKRKGGFVANFEQDSVNYPKRFHYVLGNLWEKADENEMDIKELQSKLKDVAKLVSESEIAVSENTPSWY